MSKKILVTASMGAARKYCFNHNWPLKNLDVVSSVAEAQRVAPRERKNILIDPEFANSRTTKKILAALPIISEEKS